MAKIPTGPEIKSYFDVQCIVAHVINTYSDPEPFSASDILEKVREMCEGCPIELDDEVVQKIVFATIRTFLASGKIKKQDNSITYHVLP